MKVKKILKTMVILIAMNVMMLPASAFAAETGAKVRLNADNSITFSNLDNVNGSVEFEVTDSQGNPATISIERISSKARSSWTEWKVSFTGVVINCSFYMTVTDNKVTSTRDPWIMTVGGSYDNDSLTKSSTYAKLSFKFTSYLDLISGSCWLKGTVTGKDNDITISYSM